MTRKEQHNRYKEQHPLQCVWRGMMMRCGHHKGGPDRILKYYSDRGITVCDEWRSNFKNFESWCLANGWKKGLQIDRIDNDKGYCPSNCRFVTRSQNLRNRGNTVKVRGVPVKDYYDAYANKDIVSYIAFLQRVTKLGWPIEKALYTPTRTYTRNPK